MYYHIVKKERLKCKDLEHTFKLFKENENLTEALDRNELRINDIFLYDKKIEYLENYSNNFFLKIFCTVLM